TAATVAILDFLCKAWAKPRIIEPPDGLPSGYIIVSPSLGKEIERENALEFNLGRGGCCCRLIFEFRCSRSTSWTTRRWTWRTTRCQSPAGRTYAASYKRETGFQRPLEQPLHSQHGRGRWRKRAGSDDADAVRLASQSGAAARCQRTAEDLRSSLYGLGIEAMEGIRSREERGLRRQLSAFWNVAQHQLSSWRSDRPQQRRLRVSVRAEYLVPLDFIGSEL